MTVRSSENGNVLFFILIAIVLIGLLTVAIQSGNNSETANIDEESLVIKVSEVQRYAAELERGVKYIMENGKSESDLHFAHPDAPSAYGLITDEPPTQVFSKDGGGANYRAAPTDINDGSQWEFYGATAIPSVGTSAADLVAVLPNVTAQFCARINKINGQVQPEDSGAAAATDSTAGGCVMQGIPAQFNDGSGEIYYPTPNTMDDATFTQDPNSSPSKARPALQACVECASGFHFYHVLLAR